MKNNWTPSFLLSKKEKNSFIKDEDKNDKTKFVKNILALIYGGLQQPSDRYFGFPVTLLL